MSTSAFANNENRACFGAGCYWGTEKYFKHEFPKTGKGTISDGLVGFMGPLDAPANPSYRDVCSGATGHVEVYDFRFAGDNNTYRELVRFFFQFHDPTTLNAQGNDQGTQYASVIYAYTPEQFNTAKEVIVELQDFINAGKVTSYSKNIVTTDVRMSTEFFAAHTEHQEYLDNNPNGYCNHRFRLKTWPTA